MATPRDILDERLVRGEPLDRWKSLTKQQRDNIWNKFNREMGLERG